MYNIVHVNTEHPQMQYRTADVTPFTDALVVKQAVVVVSMR